jgi:hypothetical protein
MSNYPQIVFKMSNELSLVDRGVLDSFPQVDFPFKFYDFMREASLSHPKVVAWSDCGTFFRVDRHSPELPDLLRKHFKRKCVHCILGSSAF